MIMPYITAKVAILQFLSSQGIEVSGIDWIAPTLEDVFISSIRS